MCRRTHGGGFLAQAGAKAVQKRNQRKAQAEGYLSPTPESRNLPYPSSVAQPSSTAPAPHQTFETGSPNPINRSRSKEEKERLRKEADLERQLGAPPAYDFVNNSPESAPAPRATAAMRAQGPPPSVDPDASTADLPPALANLPILSQPTPALAWAVNNLLAAIQSYKLSRSQPRGCGTKGRCGTKHTVIRARKAVVREMWNAPTLHSAGQGPTVTSKEGCDASRRGCHGGRPQGGCCGGKGRYERKLIKGQAKMLKGWVRQQMGGCCC